MAQASAARRAVRPDIVRDVNVRAVSSPVAIAGLGAVSAFGDSVAAFRDGLLSGRSAIGAVSGFDVSRCRSRVAAEVHGFDAAQWIAPMKLRRLDPTCAMAIVAVRQALEDGGATIAADGDDRTGVVLGSWTAGGATTSQFLQALCEGGPGNAPALLFSSTVGNAAASTAALELKLRGPNITVSQKEASGLGAIATAAGLIRTGRADRIVAGGADHVFEIFYRVHDRFGVMPPGEANGAATAPFDRDRAGFVLGEGGFGVLLQAGDANAPAASPAIATLLGVGAASAAVSINAWPQEPSAIVRVMTLALADAGLSPADVNVVYASANASHDLDRVEAAALSTLFGGHRPLVTSIKGAVGECGASGAASCVAAVACGMAGLVPPIAGLAQVATEAADLHLARSATPTPGPIVLINSIASGGSMFAVVLKT
jgi:3-oxoacyl-[acyl-carrier-protein] synthase II